jgi:2-oxoglutarate ferredoxin oxidoreductase subunit alpha
MIELQIDPHKLVSVLNYDGMPITAENILRQVSDKFKSDSHIEKSKLI